MALTITTTIGSASANSYASETEFKTWTDARLNVRAYQNATPDERQRALLMAFDRLQREPWIGDRVTETQAAACCGQASNRKPSDADGYAFSGTNN